jgi:PmbA protein
MPTDVGSLLLDPVVSAIVLDAIGRALTGGALQTRRSPFGSRSGQRVGPPHLDLVDDGRCLAAPAAAPFDDEGVLRRRTPLIKQGVLIGALHSTATATATSATHASTGNARRASHKGSPRAAPTTLRLASTESLGSMVGGLDDAICVQQLTGGEVGISSTTGRISVGGIAYRMRAGEPAGRLPTLPIASTVPELLASLTGVGDDARVVLDRAALASTLLWQR